VRESLTDSGGESGPGSEGGEAETEMRIGERWTEPTGRGLIRSGSVDVADDQRERGTTWGNRAERESSGTGKAKGREGIGDLQGTEEGWMDWGRKSGDE
jgi:hypothetical protein